LWDKNQLSGPIAGLPRVVKNMIEGLLVPSIWKGEMNG